MKAGACVKGQIAKRFIFEVIFDKGADRLIFLLNVELGSALRKAGLT